MPIIQDEKIYAKLVAGDSREGPGLSGFGAKSLLKHYAGSDTKYD